MTPRPLLHLEGAAFLLAGIFTYQWSRGSWALFALLFLSPDLSMVGYLIGPRAGSALYNAFHTYVGPLLLAAFALATDRHASFLISLVWIAHIGFDRMLGYGLKYPTRFKDTHLSPARHEIGIA